MKRVLSILLIAASIFGIYNYYENIMDVFACKTYWEEQSDQAETDLNKLGVGLSKLKKSTKTYKKGTKQVAKGKKTLTAYEAKYYAAGGKLASARSQISQGEAALEKLKDLVAAIKKVRTTYSKSWKSQFNKLLNARNGIIKDLAAPAPDGNRVYKMLYLQYPYLPKGKQEAYKAAVTALADDAFYIKKHGKKAFAKNRQKASDYKKFAKNCRTVSEGMDYLVKQAEKMNGTSKTLSAYDAEGLKTALADPEMYDQTVALMRLNILYEDDPESSVKSAKEGDEFESEMIRSYAADPATKNDIDGRLEDLKVLQYFITNRMKDYASHAEADADRLVKVQEDLATQIYDISNEVLDDSTLRNGVAAAMGAKAIKNLEKFAAEDSPIMPDRANLYVFDYYMKSIDKALQKAEKYLTKKYTTSKTSLYKAKVKYNSSLKTYNSTPSKLAKYKKKIVSAQKKLKKYVKSEKDLKRGFEQLAATEAQGGNESIKDRMGGDTNFSTKKGHLNTAKAQEAVDAGKAYLNEQGDRIKSEITGRIIATVMGIISAVLALLAALLSLFKSNRGAAIIACISAVTAAGAAVFGTSADTVYSEIAGSQIGDTPWTAAAVIAGVALVFSVTHFAAKVEDPLEDEE